MIDPSVPMPHLTAGDVAGVFDSEGHVTAQGVELISGLIHSVLPAQIAAHLYLHVRELWTQADPGALHPSYLVARVLLRSYVREVLSLMPDDHMPAAVCTCVEPAPAAHRPGCLLGSPFTVQSRRADDTPWWRR